MKSPLVFFLFLIQASAFAGSGETPAFSFGAHRVAHNTIFNVSELEQQCSPDTHSLIFSPVKSGLVIRSQLKNSTRDQRPFTVSQVKTRQGEYRDFIVGRPQHNQSLPRPNVEVLTRAILVGEQWVIEQELINIHGFDHPSDEIQGRSVFDFYTRLLHHYNVKTPIEIRCEPKPRNLRTVVSMLSFTGVHVLPYAPLCEYALSDVIDSQTYFLTAGTSPDQKYTVLRIKDKINYALAKDPLIVNARCLEDRPSTE